MPDTSDSTQAQLKNAYDLIKAKNMLDAKRVLVPIVQADKNNANAWWLLVHTLDDPTQKRQALEQVLRIQPNHQQAQAKLDKLNDVPVVDEATEASSPPPIPTHSPSEETEISSPPPIPVHSPTAAAEDSSPPPIPVHSPTAAAEDSSPPPIPTHNQTEVAEDSSPTPIPAHSPTAAAENSSPPSTPTDDAAAEIPPSRPQILEHGSTPPHDPVGRKSSKTWLGMSCFGIVGVIMLLVLLLCGGLLGGGYYTVFHTSFLLGQVEAVVESNDGVQVEGLSGSISSGFHIDRLLIHAEDDKWSSLEQIDFEFNGVSDLYYQNRLLIEQFTVGSGTIYHHSFTEGEDEDKADDPQSESGSNDNDSSGNSNSAQDGSFPEIQIIEFALSNLNFINLDTEAQSKLANLALTNFHVKEGGLDNLGEFQITGLTIAGEEFELTNLSGATSTGFHIDGFRSQDVYGNWSHLDDITFEFNGVQDLIDHKRLVITRISVGPGGELYIPWKDNETEYSKSTAATQSDTSRQNNQNGTSLTEMRVDLLLIPDLTLINPETGVTFKIDEISVKDFHQLEGQLQSLGDIVVNAGEIEFKSVDSNYFSDQPADVLQRQFKGMVRAPIDDNILNDISFDVHASFLADNEMLVYATLFDDNLTVSAPEMGKTIVIFQDFTPADYLAWDHGPLPTNLNGEISIQTNDDQNQSVVMTIAPDSHFQFGHLSFDIETNEIVAAENASAVPFIEATHQAEEGSYQLRLYPLDAEPHFAIELQLGDEENTPDLFAQVLYDAAYDNLSEDEQQTVTLMVQNVGAVE